MINWWNIHEAYDQALNLKLSVQNIFVPNWQKRIWNFSIPYLCLVWIFTLRGKHCICWMFDQIIDISMPLDFFFLLYRLQLQMGLVLGVFMGFKYSLRTLFFLKDVWFNHMMVFNIIASFYSRDVKTGLPELMVNFVTSFYKAELLRPLVEKISSVPEVVRMKYF